MFEGSSAQALCIVETLMDSNRRTLVTSQPASDSEVEILDVYAELFMAAQEIIAGRVIIIVIIIIIIKSSLFNIYMVLYFCIIRCFY